jgi:uncharacterized repeat protein (TIGR01451 family)
MNSVRLLRDRRRAGCWLLVAPAAVLVLAASAAPSLAAGPELTVTMSHSPTIVQRGDTGISLAITVTNTGDAATSGTLSVTDVLPAGIELRKLQGADFSCPPTLDVRGGLAMTCTVGSSMAPGDSLTVLSATVFVATDAPGTVTNTAIASGGGAPDATATDPVSVIDRPVFGVQDFSARSLNASSDDDTVAGGHPSQATTSFSFPTYVNLDGSPFPVQDDKDVVIELPPGFVGSAAAAPRCPLSLLAVGTIPQCPAESQVGVLTLFNSGSPLAPNALYSIVPEAGYPAAFAFKILSNTIVLYPKLRPRTGGYGLDIVTPGAGRLHITRVDATLFGVPSDGNGTGGPPIPFLSNPSDCLTAQPSTRILVDSWDNPARHLADGSPDLTDSLWKSATAPAPPVTGCDAPALASQFHPQIDATPTPVKGTKQADAPSGYTVNLTFPDLANDATDPSTTFDPDVPTAPQLKDTTVTLPAGVTISPSAADGLDGCSDLASAPASDQVRLDSTNPVNCADASKIGTVTATSPLLASHDPDTDEVTGAEPIGGDVYLVSPHPGDLSPNGDRDGKLRLLIQVENERLGINVKLPGIVTVEHPSGRLTARFENSPQFPLKNVSLTFTPGDRAALVNPMITCGSAKTTGAFTPWSRGGTRSDDGVAVLGTPDATASSAFDVSWDGKGAGCPATLPFAPSMTAGTLDPQAGASSPFTFDLAARKDREDVVDGISVALPGGLLAAVKDVPLCSNEDANSATCPTASRVGSATVAAGAGDSPFYITGQSVSLTGPYNGAPYGLAIAVHAAAGPFDLGMVVVRQGLQVNADDTHATVVSDPLPTIRDGVPLRVRRIHVVIDRPGFMRSPTSCDAKTINSMVSSAGGQTADLSAPFQMTGCAKLPFAPKLAMRLTGATQTKVGGHPGVEALVTQKLGEAGIKSATVTLPLSLALDPDNAASDSLCEFGDGLKDECPAKSVIGSVTAVSPLLKGPLSGKVYFVKGLRTDAKSGRLIKTLPTLLIELRGEIDVNLRAVSSVPDGKHLVNTFPMIPDAPITSFLLKLNGGAHGILVATDGHDICAEPQAPFFSAVAQNGKRVDGATTLKPDCPLKVSRTFTSSTVRVRVTGVGPGTVTVSGRGVRTTRRTIASGPVVTLTASLTTAGRRLRRAGHDVPVKVAFLPQGAKAAKVTFARRR